MMIPVEIHHPGPQTREQLVIEDRAFLLQRPFLQAGIVAGLFGGTHDLVAVLLERLTATHDAFDIFLNIHDLVSFRRRLHLFEVEQTVAIQPCLETARHDKGCRI